ncbi:MAG: hypothetical protein PHU71_07085 [Candidatus Gracilibacteria bacterium]|nr:hypothetical protein [Candidatus Gracilibacteria bacterium]
MDKELKSKMDKFISKYDDPKLTDLIGDLVHFIEIRDEHIEWLSEVIPHYADYLIKMDEGCNAQLDAMIKMVHIARDTLDEKMNYINDLEEMYLRSNEVEKTALEDLNDLREKHGYGPKGSIAYINQRGINRTRLR